MGARSAFVAAARRHAIDGNWRGCARSLLRWRSAIRRGEAARARPTGLSAGAERRPETEKRRAKLLGRIEAQYSTWCAGEMPPDARLKWSIEELEEHLNELLEARGLRERAPREG